MIGTTVGPYRITAKLGAGGMGEVYRATDTKLKRDVALKVLPEAFARDPERLARFEREAEVLASLNHPNIAAIYGVVEDRALVMELVEGAEPKGPLPFDEAWAIMSQIAAALDYAHEKGIVHRDLKPANIKVTADGVVKLLDFGLAKAFSNQPESAANPENSPTLTIGATQVGVILGTAAYMSPEQAKGKSVDKRADIWAFGVVLYELLTGERLFKGEDVGETLASVIKEEPKWHEAPAKAQRLLKSCLEKDPKKRLRDIGDAWRQLEDAPANEFSKQRNKLAWPAVAAALLVVSIGLGAVLWRVTRPVDHSLMRMSVDLGPDAVVGSRTTVAVSPDGTRIVFPTRVAGGVQKLAMRLLDQTTPILLPETDDAADPFFSPDGQWIGFSANNKLKKISVLGGAAVTLSDAPNMRGGSWGEDGNIVVALSTLTGLSRVSATGGTPQPITKLSHGELSHRWPQMLPGASAVLFTASTNAAQFDDAEIEAVFLKTGEIKTLVRGGHFGRYLTTGGPVGFLTYIHEGVLFGVPFDAAKLELRGIAVPLLEDLASDPGSGGGQFDFSHTGIFVYRSGKSAARSYPIVWVDSSGKTQPLVPTPSVYTVPRLSPDGERLALAMDTGKGRDVYVYDLRREALSRLSFTGDGGNPRWAPDGKHIVFWSANSFWWIRADGAGEAQRLLETKTQMFVNSFSPDGRHLAYHETTPETKIDAWTLPLDLSDPEHPKPGKPELFLRTPFNEGNMAFSPDGRWVAYASDESGRFEIYVRPFPGPGGKWQISTGGGIYAFWSRDGRELYFLATPEHRIMVADYMAKGDSFVAGKPRLWSDARVRPAAPGFPPLDLAPDGKRFAILPDNDPEEAQSGSLHVTFLLNFFDELRRRVPVNK